MMYGTLFVFMGIIIYLLYDRERLIDKHNKEEQLLLDEIEKLHNKKTDVKQRTVSNNWMQDSLQRAYNAQRTEEIE